MTTTDELREAVARRMCESADGPWHSSLCHEYWRREADRIIHMVVEACARIGPDAVATLGLPEEPQYEGDVRHIERRAVLGYSDRIRELAPKGPAP